jgi:glycine betaine/proline transport system ATP-binding protein
MQETSSAAQRPAPPAAAPSGANRVDDAPERPIKIATRNLTKVFGPRPERAIEHIRAGGSKLEAQERLGNAIGVYDVSLDIREGETFVLMGLSGSGKSTLLRLLNRLHEPTDGQVLVDGIDLTNLSKRELLRVRREKFSGMVFQQFAILPHRSVLDNVGYGLELQAVPARQRHERAMEAIELVGLKGWESNYPAQLSGGMQQRVGLARALAVDADVLLMDEAFSALDPLIRREMQDELLELQSRMNKTIVFVTHDLDEALKLGDRIAIMKDAQVVQIGTAEEIITSPADDYVAAFVEGVDRAEVLRAGSIMQPAKDTAHVRDGPRTVLTKLRRSGLSGILVVDSERHLHGYLSAEQLRAQLDDGSASREHVDEARMSEPTTVEVDTPLQELITLAAENPGPYAVVDDRRRLRGVIVKGAILAALSRAPAEAADDGGPDEGASHA